MYIYVYYPHSLTLKLSSLHSFPSTFAAPPAAPGPRPPSAPGPSPSARRHRSRRRPSETPRPRPPGEPRSS